MNDIQPSGMKFTPSVSEPAKAREVKHKDGRSWTDKMFQDFNRETGEAEAIDVNIIDCAENSTLGSVNVGNDNIAILMDFAANVDTTAMLKNEDVVVLGGNRAGRGGQGRLYVPVSQFPQFLQHCAALYESINTELPGLREQVRGSREGEPTEDSMNDDSFMS